MDIHLPATRDAIAAAVTDVTAHLTRDGLTADQRRHLTAAQRHLRAADRALTPEHPRDRIDTDRHWG